MPLHIEDEFVLADEFTGCIVFMSGFSRQLEKTTGATDRGVSEIHRQQGGCRTCR